MFEKQGERRLIGGGWEIGKMFLESLVFGEYELLVL